MYWLYTQRTLYSITDIPAHWCSLPLSKHPRWPSTSDIKNTGNLGINMYNWAFIPNWPQICCVFELFILLSPIAIRIIRMQYHTWFIQCWELKPGHFPEIDKHFTSSFISPAPTSLMLTTKYACKHWKIASQGKKYTVRTKWHIELQAN